MHLGENLWFGGDKFRKEERRGQDMPWVHQPSNFVIEQQDPETWWILASASYTNGRTDEWMRAWAFGFRDALESFIFDPTKLVHGKLPNDDFLLEQWKLKAIKAGYLENDEN